MIGSNPRRTPLDVLPPQMLCGVAAVVREEQASTLVFFKSVGRQGPDLRHGGLDGPFPKAAES